MPMRAGGERFKTLYPIKSLEKYSAVELRTVGSQDSVFIQDDSFLSFHLKSIY